MADERPLGRRTPTDWRHRERHPLMAVREEDAPAVVEVRLDLPDQYTEWYDQGEEGACVGFSLSWMQSIKNRRKYVARKLYSAAQDIDEWDDTPPAEGTSVRAGCEILRTQGHWRFFRGLERALGLFEGVESYQWARTVDQLRACIAAQQPFVMGVNWYSAFDEPLRIKTAEGRWEWWIGVDERGAPLPSIGRLRGGHAICAYKASDRRQAFGLVNTWGRTYPRVWVSYDIVQRLVNEDGEACITVDR